METRYFPDTPLGVSVLGLGCNNFGTFIGQDAANRVVEAALEAGVTLFDTAASYGEGNSERFLGRALGGSRNDILVATKFPQVRGEGSCRPGRIRADCEASLKRLGRDYIDLYQQHGPDDTDIEDILAVLNDLVNEGKIRAFGHSNFSAPLHDAAEQAAQGSQNRFVSSQVHWNLLDRDVEVDVIPAVERNGLGVLPYYPLASGLLTGKHRRGAIQPGSRLDKGQRIFGSVLTEDNFQLVDALTRFALDNGRSLLELSFQWLASQRSVISVIAGATKPEQVGSNSMAVRGLLDADQLREIDTITSQLT